MSLEIVLNDDVVRKEILGETADFVLAKFTVDPVLAIGLTLGKSLCKLGPQATVLRTGGTPIEAADFVVNEDALVDVTDFVLQSNVVFDRDLVPGPRQDAHFAHEGVKVFDFFLTGSVSVINLFRVSDI